MLKSKIRSQKSQISLSPISIWKDIQREKQITTFLWANFLCLDVVHTVIAFMAVYANKVMGFAEARLTTFLVLSTFFAFFGSYVLGFMTHWIGPKKSLERILLIWIGALILAMVSWTEAAFWIVGPLMGLGMGGVWVAGRALLIELSPKEKIGEFFGLYGLSGKSASILGPLIWGLVVYLLEPLGVKKYRLALFVEILLMILALVILKKVKLTSVVRSPLSVDL